MPPLETDSGVTAFGCLFPGECCMPGLHFPSECHTAEMMEELNREAEANELKDHLMRLRRIGKPGEEWEKRFEPRYQEDQR